MNSSSFLYVVLFLSFVFFSCNPSYEYEKHYEIDKGDWAYADTLDFAFNIADSLKIYNLYLEVVHSPDFASQNLYTRVKTKFPQGEKLEELLSLELSDTETGNWLGNCNKEKCTLQIPIQQGAHFNQIGDYVITLEQYMRKDPTTGVYKIGFQLEDTGMSR